MRALEKIAQTQTGGGQTLELCRHDGKWLLMLDRGVLRSLDATLAEEKAVVHACQHLAPKRQPRLLLDGLGLGVALVKARAVLPPRAKIHVAEPEAAVVQWHRQYLNTLTEDDLSSDHLTILDQSLKAALQEHEDYFDAVILDSEEAPSPLITNPREAKRHVPALKRALRSGGRAVLRSGSRDRAIQAIFAREGFRVDEHLEPIHKRSKSRMECLTVASLTFQSHAHPKKSRHG